MTEALALGQRNYMPHEVRLTEKENSGIKKVTTLLFGRRQGGYFFLFATIVKITVINPIKSRLD